MAKLLSGTRIYGNVTVDTFVTATGNVIAGNVITVGLVSATGNVTGGNITTAGLITATGNIQGGNLRTAGLISATGNVNSGNTITSRVVISANSAVNTLVSVTDTAPQGTSSAFSIINSGNTISILPNISAGSFNSLQSNGDIAILTTGPTIGNVGFSIIPWSSATSGIKMNTVSNVTTITLAAVTLSTTGNITGGIGNLTTGNILTPGIMSSTGNAIHGNVLTAGLISATSTITSAANVIGGNISTAGLVSATGNITGGNILSAGIISTSGNIFGGGIRSTSSGTAPASPSVGDFWYNTTTNVQYRFTFDGTSYYWIDDFGASTGMDGTFNAITNGTSNATVAGNGNITITIASTAIAAFTTAGLTNMQASAVGNIGNTAVPFNTVFAKATSAVYADLAETYIADAGYAPGTLVIFGGADEITASTQSHDTRVAGVISTAPAYLMNSGTVGLPVALTGRVPCSVVGTIRKGDRLVSSDIKGVATVLDSNKYLPGCIIGKSLEDYNSNLPGVIEVAIGRY